MSHPAYFPRSSTRRSPKSPAKAIVVTALMAWAASMVFVYGNAVVLGLLTDPALYPVAAYTALGLNLLVHVAAGWCGAGIVVRGGAHTEGVRMWAVLGAGLGGIVGAVLDSVVRLAFAAVAYGGPVGPSVGALWNVLAWTVPVLAGGALYTLVRRRAFVAGSG